MTALLFPDNTVLINFAVIQRMDLLGRLANGNGRWCATVAQECAESSEVEGLSSLTEAPAIFGDPLFPETPAEHFTIRTMRQTLAEPDDPPRRHLGEAETLTIMTMRLLNGFFVTDDRGAQRLADQYGIPVVDTWKLMQVAVHREFVDRATMRGYVHALEAAGRHVPRHILNAASFNEWASG